jgi:hypothetical protein
MSTSEQKNLIKPNVSESASHKNVFLNGIDSGRSMSSMSRIRCESRQLSDADRFSPSKELLPRWECPKPAIFNVDADDKPWDF